MRRSWRTVVGVALLVSLLGGAVAARADEFSDSLGDEDIGHPVIVWVGAVATNLFYVPSKIVYAFTGGVIGGLAWVVSGGDTDASRLIWDPSMRGTYLVTPSMLEGRDEVHFIGP